MLKTIRKYSDEVITDDDKKKIYSILIKSNIKDRNVRKKHVETIRCNKAENEQKIENKVCPKCGGKLIKRNGRYGAFWGCSNYPKCKFTLKL